MQNKLKITTNNQIKIEPIEVGQVRSNGKNAILVGREIYDSKFCAIMLNDYFDIEICDYDIEELARRYPFILKGELILSNN